MQNQTRLHLPPPDSASTQSMRAGSAKADGGQVPNNLPARSQKAKEGWQIEKLEKEILENLKKIKI